MSRKRKGTPRTCIVVSDLHAGCQLGLYPKGYRVPLTHGGAYSPSPLQLKMHAMWAEFWKDWVPWFTKGEPFGIPVGADGDDPCRIVSVPGGFEECAQV